MKKRVTFYFDGFNFYNGLRSMGRINPMWKRYYWINFYSLCEQFIDTNQFEIVKIKYFTAPPLNIGKQKRQAVLLKVNELLNPGVFEVINGKYYEKPYTCPECRKDFFKPEEKRTDVNISVQLIGDCALDLTDNLILVSADSDLVPPIEFIKQNYPNKKLKVYFPPKRSSTDIFNIVNKVTFLEKNSKRFEIALMNFELTFNGKTYFIPEKWKQYL